MDSDIMVLDIGGGMILRESLRSVDRVRNLMQVVFSVEPLFGEVYSDDIAGKISSSTLFVSAARNRDAWVAMKDSSQQGMINVIADFFDRYFQIWIDFKNWEAHPVYRDIEPSVPLGAPEKELIPFDRKELIEEFNAIDTHGSFVQLFDMLIAIGVTAVTKRAV